MLTVLPAVAAPEKMSYGIGSSHDPNACVAVNATVTVGAAVVIVGDAVVVVTIAAGASAADRSAVR